MVQFAYYSGTNWKLVLVLSVFVATFCWLETSMWFIEVTTGMTKFGIPKKLQFESAKQQSQLERWHAWASITEQGDHGLIWSDLVSLTGCLNVALA
eukprot:66136-Rhodomonas_salina.1